MSVEVFRSMGAFSKASASEMRSWCEGGVERRCRLFLGETAASYLSLPPLAAVGAAESEHVGSVVPV